VLVFYEENPRLVEETALPQLPWMCKGADFAVMAEIDYDGFKLFNFCLSAVSSLDCGLFFLSGLIDAGGCLLTTAFSNSIPGRIASER
jgi:hypothetical protein